MSDDTVPASPTGYQPILPKIDGLPEGTRIDAAHPKYREAAEHAHRAGLTERQFSAFLGFEAQRVHTAAKAASAAPPPRAATLAPKPDAPAKPTAAATDTRPWKSLTFAQKLQRGAHI